MGFLDEATSMLNRGMAATGRAAETVKLKNQLNAANKNRQQLAAQLGAALYEATKDDPSLREGREALYDAIAACDAERDGYLRQISALEAESAAATQAAITYQCHVCGASIHEGDLFCSGCGTPAETIKEQKKSASSVALPAKACATCGASLSEGDRFCMSCGTKVIAAPEATEEDDNTTE